MTKTDSMVAYRKMSNIKDFVSTKTDGLALLLHLTLIPMKFKIILLIIYLVACQFSFALTLTCYRMLSTFDKNILLRHGSFGGIEIFVLINLGTVIFKHKEIFAFADYFRDIMFPLDEEILGAKYKIIMFQMKLVKMIVIVNYLLAIAAAFGFTLSPEYFNTRTYLAVWIRENFPAYSEYILFVIHLSNFPVALVLVSLSIAMSYFGFTSVFQLTLVNSLIEGICDSQIRPSDRHNSELYQNLVRQKMKTCILIHKLCIKLSIMGSDIIYVPMILFSCGGVILGGSLLLEFFTNDAGEMSNQYFGIICFAAAGTISSMLYVSSGQLVKNESERTYYLLTQLPWYFMNEDNKRTYTIILRRAEIPISMTSALMEINFLLLVRIFKAIYSIAALLAQLATNASPGTTLELQHN